MLFFRIIDIIFSQPRLLSKSYLWPRRLSPTSWQSPRPTFPFALTFLTSVSWRAAWLLFQPPLCIREFLYTPLSHQLSAYPTREKYLNLKTSVTPVSHCPDEAGQYACRLVSTTKCSYDRGVHVPQLCSLKIYLLTVSS